MRRSTQKRKRKTERRGLPLFLSVFFIWLQRRNRRATESAPKAKTKVEAKRRLFFKFENETAAYRKLPRRKCEGRRRGLTLFLSYFVSTTIPARKGKRLFFNFEKTKPPHTGRGCVRGGFSLISKKTKPPHA